MKIETQHDTVVHLGRVWGRDETQNFGDEKPNTFHVVEDTMPIGGPYKMQGDVPSFFDFRNFFDLPMSCPDTRGNWWLVADKDLADILDKLLYHLGEFVPETGRKQHRSETAEIVIRLWAACRARGWTLSRWQSNQGKYGHSITWMIHTGERAAQARRQPEDTIIKSAFDDRLEGKTVRSTWGIVLSGWLDELSEQQ